MPIVMSAKEWRRINSSTKSDREDPEVLRRREYVKYLDATSREMTKFWPNSVENVNKRSEELRLARIEAAEQANTKFYKRYLKRKKEEQERLIYTARDIVFKSRDAPKLLLSAVIATAIHKERAEQVKFNNERRREDAENKRKEDDEIIRKAKEWHELMENKKKKRFEANKQHQQDIVAQAHEISERKRKEHEMELNLQKIDNIKAAEEIKALKAFEEKFRSEEKARIFRDMERAKMQTDARKKEQESRSKMDDKLIEVLNKARVRVETRRKKTEQDLKEEKMRVLEAISQKLESGDASREAKERAMLEKAIKQKNDVDEARRQADINKKAQFRRERQAAREQFLRDEEQRLRDFNTIRQWEIMNRFKNRELYDDFKEQLRKDKERKVKEYREDILRLWREREEREADERAATRHFYGARAEGELRAADNRLLAHAAHLLDECRRLGRPEHALRKTIDQYCKMNRLYPMPPLPASLQEHFGEYAPQDSSAPDADYVPPAPPGKDKPPTPAAPESAPDVKVEKRAGLQEVAKPLPSKSSNKKSDAEAVKPSDDYKRKGPANGLQRRNLQTSDKLPAVEAVPCKNPKCHCNY